MAVSATDAWGNRAPAPWVGQHQMRAQAALHLAQMAKLRIIAGQVWP